MALSESTTRIAKPRRFGSTTRRAGIPSLGQAEPGSTQARSAMATETAALEHALGVSIGNAAKSLKMQGPEGAGERIILDRFMDPPWMKPVAEMAADSLSQKEFGNSTLIVDLAGYSRLCQVLRADVLMGIMEKFHVKMFEISQKYQGTLIREPLGDATVHYFDDPDLARLAAIEMQEAMPEFMDGAMKAMLLREGYRTEGFKINIAVVDGPIYLEIQETGPLRDTVFMGGRAYEDANKLLGDAEGRGLILTKDGVLDAEQTRERLGEKVVPSEKHSALRAPESVIEAVRLAIRLIRPTRLTPYDVVTTPDMAEMYTTMAALRLEDKEGKNVTSDPSHSLHNRAMLLLNHFCWKYPEMERCKAGDKGELIVMNRKTEDLIKMCHELSLELEKSGIVLQAGIFGGTFRAQSLYGKLSKYWWDVHSPAFASAVRAANLNKGSGQGHIMIERRIADGTPGIETEARTVTFHNMGQTNLSVLKSISPDIGKDRVPLIGRDRELAAVKEFLRTGEESALLLKGDPGMGKNYLINESAKAARESGTVTILAKPDTKEYFLRDILTQLATQAYEFQVSDEVREEKIREFIDAPAALGAMLAEHSIALKVFVPDLDKAPLESLQFLAEMVGGAKAGNFQIVASYNDSAFAEDLLDSVGFGAAAQRAIPLGEIDEQIIRDFVSDKIGRPLLDNEMATLVQEGICVPNVFACLMPAIEAGGSEISSVINNIKHNKGQVVQAILDNLLEEKDVSPSEKSILVDLSVFGDAISMELLLQFRGDSTEDALLDDIGRLRNKGLVVETDAGYQLAKSPLLPSLAMFGLKKSAELYKKAGTYFRERALTKEGAEALADFEKAVKYLSAPGIEDEANQTTLEQTIEKAIALAEEIKHFVLLLYFSQTQRRVLEKKADSLKNVSGEIDPAIQLSIFYAAYKEGSVALYLGKMPEALSALGVSSGLAKIAPPLYALCALRDHRRAFKTSGLKNTDGSLDAFRNLGTKMTEISVDNEGGKKKADVMRSLDDGLAKLSIHIRGINTITRDELIELYQTATALWEDPERLNPDMIIDLGLLAVLAANELRNKSFFRPEDLKIVREAINFGRTLIELVGSQQTPAFVMGHLVELSRAVANLSVTILDVDGIERADHDTATETLASYVAHSKKIHDVNNIARAYHSEAELFWQKGEHQTALNLNQKAFDLSPSAVDVHITSYINISYLQYELGDMEEAFVAATKALQLVRNHKNGRNYIQYFQQYIVEAYNKASEALGYSERLTKEEI